MKFVSFKKFLIEIPTGIPGKDKGFEELHQLDGEGVNGHRVYVQIRHQGDGAHKVTAVFAHPGDDVGSFSRRARGKVPANIRAAAVQKTFGSVKHFMKNNDWNSIVLGGSDKRNRTLYQHVANKMAQASGGTLQATLGHGSLQSAAIIKKTTPISNPISSGDIPHREDAAEPFRKQSGIYGSSKVSSDRSSGGSSPAAKFDTFGMKGLSGPSGPLKKKTNLDGLGALSGASGESGPSKGSKSEVKGGFSGSSA